MANIIAENSQETRRLNSLSFTPRDLNNFSIRNNLNADAYQDYTPSLWGGLIAPSERYSVEFKLGNEVGDPLFKEAIEQGPFENYTPLISLFINSPYLGFSFDQSDHYSDSYKEYRWSQISLKNLGESPSQNMSWFGENLPNSSFLNFRSGFSLNQFEFEFSSKHGWMWLKDPNTLRQLPIELSHWQTSLKLKEYRLGYGVRIFKGQGLVDTTYRSQYLTFSVKKKWKGFSNQLNLLKEWGGENSFNVNYQGQYDSYHLNNKVWYVKVDQFRNWGTASEWRGKGFVNYPLVGGQIHGETFKESDLGFQKSEQSQSSYWDFSKDHPEITLYIGIAGSPFGHLKFKSTMGPFLQFGQTYFNVSSYVTESYFEKSYTFREGNFEHKNDLYMGGMIQNELSYDLRHVLWVEYENKYQIVDSQKDLQSDYVAPAFIQRLGIELILPTNLKIETNVHLYSPYTVKGYSKDNYKQDWRLRASLVIRQYFLKRNLMFEVALLDFLGTNKPEVPGGPESRSRFIAGVKYHF